MTHYIKIAYKSETKICFFYDHYSNCEFAFVDESTIVVFIEAQSHEASMLVLAAQTSCFKHSV